MFNCFTVYVLTNFFKTNNITLFRRDSEYGYSDDTIPENIYIFEVLKLHNHPDNVSIFCSSLGWKESFCFKPSLWCWLDLRVWHGMVKEIKYCKKLYALMEEDIWCWTFPNDWIFHFCWHTNVFTLIHMLYLIFTRY